MCYRRGDQSTNFSAVAHVDKEPRLEEVRRRQWKRLFAETSLRPATAGLLAVPLIPRRSHANGARTETWQSCGMDRAGSRSRLRIRSSSGDIPDSAPQDE